MGGDLNEDDHKKDRDVTDHGFHRNGEERDCYFLTDAQEVREMTITTQEVVVHPRNPVVLRVEHIEQARNQQGACGWPDDVQKYAAAVAVNEGTKVSVEDHDGKPKGMASDRETQELEILSPMDANVLDIRGGHVKRI